MILTRSNSTMAITKRRKMSEKDKKRLVLIGISRKGEKGFKTIKKTPGKVEKKWKDIVFPFPIEPTNQRSALKIGD